MIRFVWRLAAFAASNLKARSSWPNNLAIQDIALIAISHNLAAQIFYDQIYLLPSSFTIRSDAPADRFDFRAAAESEAAKTITEQTKDVRNLLPPELELLRD